MLVSGRVTDKGFVFLVELINMFFGKKFAHCVGRQELDVFCRHRHNAEPLLASHCGSVSWHRTVCPVDGVWNRDVVIVKAEQYNQLYYTDRTVVSTSSIYLYIASAQQEHCKHWCIITITELSS